MPVKILLSMAAVLALATPAAAQDQATRDDVRCLVLTFMMAGSANAQTQQQGFMGALYYLGKLDGRSPGLDLETRLRAEMPKMTPDQIKAEAPRCGQELIVRGQQVTAMGARLKDLQTPGAAPAAPH